jgi:uncharacterized glyoxalase superfamily protein PhnB
MILTLKEISRSPGPDGKSIMHAELRIGDSLIFLSAIFLSWLLTESCPKGSSFQLV